MKLIGARVTNYRSIRDSTEFEIEELKTILVGPNEAGKTALLRALQQVNPPADVAKFDTLRDYPRSSYNDVTIGAVDPAKTDVVIAKFKLDDEDKAAIDDSDFHDCTYEVGRRIDNSFWQRLCGGPKSPTYGQLKNDLLRLATHMDANIAPVPDGTPVIKKPSTTLSEITSSWFDQTVLKDAVSSALEGWLNSNTALVDEKNAKEMTRFEKLQIACGISQRKSSVVQKLQGRLPVFVLFSNYFRVRPIIHLDHLAKRIDGNLLDGDQYDYGNLCLLKLLGFTARQLSDLGKVAEPPASDASAMKAYRDQLDKRQYQLNAASVRLTEEIRSVWNPDPTRAEADRLRIVADGQYLKVVVEDDLGVEIELDQRSEGFQWLVSFFIVFFAESEGKHKNAILLLDEPGLSLHGLKQRDFRDTISRLAKANQTIYTTHSPFLVGPDELDLVRVVEMTNRKVGTKVHTEVTADDPASLLPLQGSSRL